MKNLILGLSIILIWNKIVLGEIELPSIKIEDEEDILELAIDKKISWDDYYTLNYLYQHPLDLNEAEISQLQELPNVSFELAQKIYKNRPFKTNEEIIPIIGKDIFDQIKVFIQSKKVWEKNFYLYLTETKDDNKKPDVKVRLHLYNENMEAGILGRGKEEEFKLNKRYLMLKLPQPILRKVVIGNTQARFGEGIVFNTAHRTTYQGIVLDDSERESDIQDGILIETSLNKINFTFFYSYVDLDKFPNLVLSEFNDKEKLWGGNLKLVKGNNELGATGYVSNFTSKKMDEDKRIEIVGIDFRKQFKDAEIAYEKIVKNENQGKGVYIRGYKKLDNFKYWLSLRKYDRDFINPHSRVGKGDEKGASGKIEYNSNSLKLKVFADYHTHLSTLITDEKYWTSIEYKLSPKLKITNKIEYEDKDIIRAGNEKESYYFELDSTPHSNLDINSGYKYTNKDEEITDYVYTKITYRVSPKVSLINRFKYGPKGARQVYSQISIKKDKKEFSTKYTYTHSKLNPHNFYLRMKVMW